MPYGYQYFAESNEIVTHIGTEELPFPITVSELCAGQNNWDLLETDPLDPPTEYWPCHPEQDAPDSITIGGTDIRVKVEMFGPLPGKKKN